MAATDRLDGTELGDCLADLTTGSNIHPGVRTIAAGIRTIAEDPTLTPTDVQLLLAQLAASPDACDTVGAIAALIEHLTTATQPALNPLPAPLRKDIQHQGELAAWQLRDPDLRTHPATACAALDTPAANSGQCSVCGGTFPDWNGGVCDACRNQ
ncbi:hypothetical protein D0Z67_29185 (plasmid) [Streptomyces seoulensis]|uniref:Uncharacterized protein n=1 Tax=Streptomyces seoulensis TaxID=73044 RepID=A0A4P6U2U3_STRSO|nr:hypothetical protein [Streptomyces seoulensis]QBJ94445.1 hypothetical protein D0Z67_29185 [Streptomyces seoulensis]